MDGGFALYALFPLDITDVLVWVCYLNQALTFEWELETWFKHHGWYPVVSYVLATFLKAQNYVVLKIHTISQFSQFHIWGLPS